MDKNKKEDEHVPSPFEGVMKNAVLHEANMFNDSMIDAEQCATVLTRIMYLVIHGEVFTSDEATKLFFSVTKLFRSNDPMLRRLVYLVVKELGRNQENVFIVINCLSKDITSNMDLFQANAIRVLSKIIDANMLGQMERFIKQALVDRNPLVSGSALISGQTLFKISPDVVKRWVNEVQDALNSSSSPMVQYHALALLYQIKKNDRLALSKVISALAKKPPKSPLAHCLLIRYTLQVLGMNPQGAEEKALMDFLVSSLHKSNSMVNFEAAKALCFLPSATPAQIAPAITVLQELLNSAVPCQRFAAVRTLNAIVSKFPMYVAPCRVDLELLITDSNRSIATLAITTLLKTGVEGSIDTLMKTMSGFMSEIGDDLRIVLIEAIQQLVVKFPYKFDIFLEFLSSILREEGGFTYKKTIVDSIISILKANEEAKELCLEYLCDFIEDCEYPLLSVQILDFLGQEGPKTKSPSRFIRYIFNRVILEQPRVRSAAVASLAKFAAVVPSLTDSVLALMQRCLIDNDDEVRDRAVYYSEIFSEDREEAANTLQHHFNIPLSSLEYSLYRYVEGDALTPFTPGDISAAPEDAKPSAEQKSSEIKEEVLAIKDNSIDALKSIPEFEALGKLYKSCKLVEVTESEAEYRVTCVKHIFARHVLLQFNVTNNMQQVLSNILVETETDNPEWAEEMAVPLDELNPSESGTCFVCLARPDGAFASGLLHNTLKFNVREVGDDISDAFEDTYHLEEVEILPTDFISPGSDQSVGDFRNEWESLDGDNEVVKRFNLSMKDIQEAVNGIIQVVSMKAVSDSDKVAEGSKSHTVNLSGKFITGDHILARAGFAVQDGKPGIILKIASRARNSALSQIVPSSIR